MLDKYDDSNSELLRCINTDEKYEGAQCVSSAFQKCFDGFQIHNELKHSGSGLIINQIPIIADDIDIDIDIDMSYNGDSSATSYIQYENILYFNRPKIDPQFELKLTKSPVFWLGGFASSEDWVIPEENSVLSKVIKRIVLSKVMKLCLFNFFVKLNYNVKYKYFYVTFSE
jgi:hypothetical protein